MKLKLILVILFFSLVSQAALDDLIFIQGQIGGSFDKEKVKVTDSNDQTYYLPKNVFPAGFKFEKGKTFNVQVPIEVYKNLDFKLPTTTSESK